MGLPTTIFQDSTLYSIGAVLVTSLLVHMGTLLSVQQLKEQWRTVLIALAAVVGVAIAILLIARPIIGTEAAFISAPPVAGGVVAGIQMANAATEIGRDDLAVLASLLVVLQGFIGYPLGSFALKKEAKKVLANFDVNKVAKSENIEKVEVETKRPLSFIANLFTSENYFLARTVIVALLATYASKGLTLIAGRQILDANVIALLFGVIFSELGFLEKGILTKANSMGLSMAALIAVILNNLSKATPEIVLNLLPTIVIALLIATVGIIIFSVIVGKILNISPWLSIGIGSSALFGFPGTFVISNEVAKAESSNEEEKQAILDAILPKMLVAGFITVSIASVILAGVLSSMLISIAS